VFRKAAPPVRPEAAGAASVDEIAPCQKLVKLRVAPEAIAPVRAAVVAEFQREAALPGFRKGKAPADLIERQYAKNIQEELLRRLTQRALEETAKAHDLKPVGPFEVRAAQFSETEGLRLEAAVEVEPSFALGDYKGLPVGAGSEEVTPEEVDQALVALRESMAQLVPGKEGQEGQEKERRVPALDDELAKDLGLDNVPKLREHVEAKLREQKRLAQARARETAVTEALLRRHPFEVPPGLVSHQTDRLTRDFKVRLLLSGTPEEQVEQEAAKFTEQLRQAGERHVKLLFILDRIADREGIAVTQDELVGHLWRLAQRWKKDPVQARKILDERGLWPSVASAIRQEKTMALVLRSAVVENGGVA